jgi:hypothetical protein
MTHRIMFLLIAFSLMVPGSNLAQTKPGSDCPMMSTHQRGVNERGDRMMGFSHDKTAHHFRLYEDGGAIEVQANDSEDTASRDQIRAHLSHIAQMFAAGDFNAPMLTHGRVPPGVPTMKRLKDAISYQYSEMERGGVVRITTENPAARKAIHQFLRFQISDHQTGDSLQVGDSKRNGMEGFH